MKENKLTRFGISMDEALLVQFDEMIEKKGYPNRSEAVRDLIRDAILQNKWTDGEEVVAGTIMLFYDHHHNNLVDEMMRIQHDYHENILATTHLHIDHHNCLEIIVVKGKTSLLRNLSDRLISLKGVFYGKLTVSPLNK
jgi:CopG family nickel-responsive transcriptional regulator